MVELIMFITGSIGMFSCGIAFGRGMNRKIVKDVENLLVAHDLHTANPSNCVYIRHLDEALSDLDRSLKKYR